MDECTVLLQIRVLDDGEGRVVEVEIDGLAEKSLKTVGALEDPARTGDASLR